MTGGLGFAGGNTQFLAQDMVQQRGFAHVRPAHNGHKTTTAVRIFRAGNIIHQEFSTPSCLRALRAACCSAIRRLLPVPLVFRSSDGKAQETWNVCSWASPSTEITS